MKKLFIILLSILITFATVGSENHESAASNLLSQQKEELRQAVPTKKVPMIDIADNNGDTALMLALKNPLKNPDDNMIAIVEFLLSQKANTSVRNLEGKTALDIAKETGNTRAIALLEKYTQAYATSTKKEVAIPSNR